jgi:hypothetical protein
VSQHHLTSFGCSEASRNELDIVLVDWKDYRVDGFTSAKSEESLPISALYLCPKPTAVTT